jgi:hypothetical protein
VKYLVQTSTTRWCGAIDWWDVDHTDNPVAWLKGRQDSNQRVDTNRLRFVEKETGRIIKGEKVERELRGKRDKTLV